MRATDGVGTIPNDLASEGVHVVFILVGGRVICDTFDIAGTDEDVAVADITSISDSTRLRLCVKMILSLRY